MGTVTRPVGPLPPRVYWVRRLALLVVLVLVVVLATVVVRAVTDSDAAAGDAPGAQATVGTPDDEEPADDAPAADAEEEPADADTDAGAEADSDEQAAEPVATESAAGEGAATPECTKADVALALRSDASTYRSGADPVFTLDVTNAGDAPCLVDVTAASRELLIVSGPARVWSSADCADPAARLLLLGPGQVDSQEVSWARVRSNEDCSLKDVEAKPGTYRATASLLGRSTDELVFVLG